MLIEWRVSQRGVDNERSWWALVNCHLPQGIPLQCGFNRAKWEAAELPRDSWYQVPSGQCLPIPEQLLGKNHQQPAQEWLPGSSPHEWRWKTLTSSEVPGGPASTTTSGSHPLFWRKIWHQQCQKFNRRGKCGFWDNAVAWLTEINRGRQSEKLFLSVTVSLSSQLLHPSAQLNPCLSSGRNTEKFQHKTHPPSGCHPSILSSTNMQTWDGQSSS